MKVIDVLRVEEENEERKNKKKIEDLFTWVDLGIDDRDKLRVSPGIKTRVYTPVATTTPSNPILHG